MDEKQNNTQIPFPLTERLFETDSYCRRFQATVLACIPTKDGKYEIITDRTAFFPEAGGQLADCGILGGIAVADVRENSDGSITHILPAPLPLGAVVDGEIDWNIRYRRMQNHSGEHLLSGLVYATYGLHNVGFHLGENGMTVDFDGYLDRTQLNALEDTINRHITEMHPITVRFPSSEELAKMAYRSKISLAGRVRIITIEGCDVCACCAPHVANTGEIGLAKILDATRYKGGVRLHMLCGQDALEDYRTCHATVSALSASLSVPKEEVLDGVDRLREQLSDAAKRMTDLRRELIAYRAAAAQVQNGTICLIEETADMLYLRQLVNACLVRCKYLCAAFAGNDRDGYRYIIASQTVDLRQFAPQINRDLHGRGGGSPQMIQGSVTASADQIRAFFARKSF